MDNPHIALFSKAKSSWIWPIYVPSYTRAGSALFLNFLNTCPPAIQDRVHIVVRKEERAAYAKCYPWATLVTVHKPGLGPARSMALTDAHKRRYSRIVMLDDDIRHVSLLQRIERDGKPDHTRRYSTGVSGMVQPYNFLRSLSVACKLAEGVFALRPNAVYGAIRNALFSGDVDTSIGATVNRGTMPAAVMFYDLTRMENFELPKRFHLHGEDIAFAMDVMTRGQEWFSIQVAAHDADSGIASTIPLDPLDSVARRVDIENAALDYPEIYPYLRESMKNKAGGVMRVGIHWPRWYKDTNSGPVDILLADIIKEIK